VKAVSQEEYQVWLQKQNTESPKTAGL
jgi:hypothetical protein